MSETEKKKWYQLSPEWKGKIRQIGIIFSGVILYLLYNLQPALLNMINHSELDDTWKIYLLGAVPVILMGSGSMIVILFSLQQGQAQAQQMSQQVPAAVGTPTSQIVPPTPVAPQPAPVPTETTPPPTTEATPT